MPSAFGRWLQTKSNPSAAIHLTNVNFQYPFQLPWAARKRPGTTSRIRLQTGLQVSTSTYFD